jgi:hypothetical protein
MKNNAFESNGAAPAPRAAARDDLFRRAKGPPALVLTDIEPSCRLSLPHRARGQCIVLVLTGFGKLVIDSDVHRFRGPCTLLLPPRAECALVNIGVLPLRTVFVRAGGTSD